MKAELRLALAMRGGVSLAVWIGGACSEIDIARRETTGDSELADFPSFWAPLLATSQYDRISVDVLAGASAGGLNGVLYATSQVYDFSYSFMRGIWLELGSTETLVRRAAPWPSLFRGDDYFLEKLHAKLVELTAIRAAFGMYAQAPLLRPRLDLVLSATVIQPITRSVPSPSDEPLTDRRFASGFHFQQPEQRWLPSHFPPSNGDTFDQALWRLSIGGRATSSYPGAFEAAEVWAQRRATFASVDAPSGDGKSVDLDGSFLDRDSTSAFLVVDGGVLDNIPIQRALDAVAAAPAVTPSKRIVLYLQPGARAQRVEVAGERMGDARSTLAVARGVMRARVAGETINDDIAALEAHNEAIDRAGVLRRSRFGDLLGTTMLLGRAEAARESYCLARATEESLRVATLLANPVAQLGEDPFPSTVAGVVVLDGRWRSPIGEWSEAERSSLTTGLSTYLWLQLQESVESPLGQVLTATGDPRPLFRVTELLLEWARHLEDSGVAAASGVKGRLYVVRAFIEAVLDRTRRLAWVAAAALTDDYRSRLASVAAVPLNTLNSVDPVRADAIRTALLTGEDALLEDVRRDMLASIDGVVADMLPLLPGTAMPTPATPTGQSNLLPIVADLLSDLGQALAEAPAPDASEVVDRSQGALLRAALAGGPVSTDVLGALEILCLPEFVSGKPGRARVEFRRMSSANPTPLATDFQALNDRASERGLWWNPQRAPADQRGIHVDLKLAGNELANFSAFLLAHWRANDWMWGRLDAVPTLVEIIVRPEDFGQWLAGTADPAGAVKELVAPADHRWRVALESNIWQRYEEQIEAEVNTLIATPENDRANCELSNVREALVARRQWEILGAEYKLPKSPMGHDPAVEVTSAPAFEAVQAWVAAYTVGAEQLRANERAPELIDRFGELAASMTETLLSNIADPESPVPRLPAPAITAVRRIGPRLGTRLATGLIQRPRATSQSSKKSLVALSVAATVILAALGAATDLQAFLMGLLVAVVPLASLIWLLYRRARKLLEKPNPWLSRRVISFAHQGGAGEGPASTIQTMTLARERGAAALEFDLHLTYDNKLVLHHDAELAANGPTVKIADKDLSELREMKPELATLDEVLAAFPGVPLTVEIKAGEAAELAARTLVGETGDRPVIVTAFAQRTVTTVMRVAPDLDTAPGWPTILGFWLVSRFWVAPPIRRNHAALQVALRLDQVAVVKSIPIVRRLRVADRRFVNAAHQRGLAVHVWTLNDEATIREALDAGADGVISDRPSVLTQTLKAAGAYWRGP